MTLWTIDKELLSLAAEYELPEASKKLGLPTIWSRDQIELVRDWWKAGAETYCLIFALNPVEAPRQEYIFKAFVPDPGTYSVAEALAKTLERQQHLAMLGARVPRHYAGARGTALVDYVKHDLEEYLLADSTSIETCRSLCSAATEMAGIVAGAGYRPIDFVRDLRTDGEDVYIIDFGWDLGPPGVAQFDDCSLPNTVRAWCSKVLERRCSEFT